MTNEPKAAECECRKALKSIREELGAAVLWNDETAKIDEVLAAPCECQNIYRWSCGHLRLGSEPAGPCPTCECERLRKQRDGAEAAVIQLDGERTLVRLNCIEPLQLERDRLRAELRQAKEEAIRAKWDLDTANANVLELAQLPANLRAELERTRAELAEAVDALRIASWALNDAAIGMAGGRLEDIRSIGAPNALFEADRADMVLAKHKEKA